jgi:excisionase family DNA binding protein
MGTSPKLVTTAEVARQLHRAERTVRRWVAMGRLRGQKVGRSWVVEEPSVASLS